MQTGLAHIQFNVGGGNRGFYRELFAFLGWATLYDAPEILGLAGKNGESFWFGEYANEAKNDYDGAGVNHIGIGAESQADVDAVVEYLRDRGVELLFETPRHRPEFSGGEGQTYYQVMFESPDRILFEVVYTGPKTGQAAH
jgi:catechol 2,3-dioxygenase-like lactoylglutathione lyase family enzyme